MTPLTRLAVTFSVIILAFVAWAKWDASRHPLPARETAPRTAGAQPQPAQVAAFIAYGTGSSSPPEMRLDHAYTAEGLRKLSDAVAAITPAEAPPGVRSTVDDLRAAADHLQRDPRSLEHAEIARRAFLAAADAIAAVAHVDTGAVRDAAGAVDGHVPLLQQRQRVHAFFHAAAEALSISPFPQSGGRVALDHE